MEALKLFRTRSESSNSSQYCGFSPYNSRGFNTRRPDDSPLRRTINLYNSRHGRFDLEDLNSSDFSTVKKLEIEKKHARLLQQ